MFLKINYLKTGTRVIYSIPVAFLENFYSLIHRDYCINFLNYQPAYIIMLIISLLSKKKCKVLGAGSMYL